jgi:sigma-E factor negative regulatory protein RseA
MTTEQIRRQISLFMDDELTAEECQFFVRRLQRDDASRNLYMRYQLIGAAIRGEHVSAGHGKLRNRLQSALTETAEPKPARSMPPGARSTLKAVAGVGIAASVAVVALLVLRGDFSLDRDAALTAAAGTLPRLERVEPPSYVVPLQAPPPQVVTPAVRLTGLQYLMHHSGHASGFSRTVVHSNVLSAESEDIIAAAEATQQ